MTFSASAAEGGGSEERGQSQWDATKPSSAEVVERSGETPSGDRASEAPWGQTQKEQQRMDEERAVNPGATAPGIGTTNPTQNPAAIRHEPGSVRGPPFSRSPPPEPPLKPDITRAPEKTLILGDGKPAE